MMFGVKVDLCLVAESECGHLPCTHERPRNTDLCGNSPKCYTTFKLLVKKVHLNIHCLDDGALPVSWTGAYHTGL